MSQIMARVRVCPGLTRYRSLRTLLTSTGESSNRVLDGAFHASLYSRSAVSNAMADANPPRTRHRHPTLHGFRHGARFKQCSISTSSDLSFPPMIGRVHWRPKSVRQPTPHRLLAVGACNLPHELRPGHVHCTVHGAGLAPGV